jgi:PTS system mannose-specific IIB component
VSPSAPLFRVDNRLVHGQVLEAWVPALGLSRLLVADDEAAGDELTRTAMGLALPDRVALEVLTVAAAAARLRADGPGGTLVLLREVADAARLAEDLAVPGPLPTAPLRRLNLGNVHFRAGRRPVAPTVYLDEQELQQLEALSRAGTEVEARAVPAERPLFLADLRARFAAAKA